jgi:hypothetical protein
MNLLRKISFAGAVAAGLAIVAYPRSAHADIGLHDLNQAVEDLLDGLKELLLAPMEALPQVLIPNPLPEPPIGEHVEGNPLSTAQAIIHAKARIEDRIHRVTSLDDIMVLAGEASVINQKIMAVIGVLNAADPISVASLQQLTNLTGLINGVSQNVQSQVTAAQSSLQADDAVEAEYGRGIAMEQYAAWTGYDEIAGGVHPEVGHVPTPWN